MKVKSTVAASLLIGACAISGTVNAQETQFESIISTMVETAISEVSEELKNEIEENFRELSRTVLSGEDDRTQLALKSENSAVVETAKVNQMKESID